MENFVRHFPWPVLVKIYQKFGKGRDEGSKDDSCAGDKQSVSRNLLSQNLVKHQEVK